MRFVVGNTVTADGAAYTIIEFTVLHLEFHLWVVVGGFDVGWLGAEGNEAHALGGVDEADEFFAVCTEPVLTVRSVKSCLKGFRLRNSIGVERERCAEVHAFVCEK